MQGFFSIYKSVNVTHHINKLKNRNHIIISTDAEKAFNKIQCPFMIKPLQMDLKGNSLNVIKAIFNKSTASIILNGEEMKIFPLKVKNKTKVSTLTTIIKHSFGSPSHDSQRRKKEIKEIQIGKEVKLSLFAYDMILYIENPKDASRK